MTYKSESMRSLCKTWLATNPPADQIAFVDSVYEIAEKNYERGGDLIVECFEPSEILEDFKTLDDVRERCGLRIEAALNARWGEDDDPELAAADRFKEWESATN